MAEATDDFWRGDFPLVIPQILKSPVIRRSANQIVDSGGARFGYPELVERIGRFANVMKGAGAVFGSTVAIMDWDSCRYLESYFAVPGMGCLLQTVNVRLSPEQVAYTLDHAGAEVLIVHEDFLPMFAETAGRLPKLRSVLTIGDAADASKSMPVIGDLGTLCAAASPDFPFPDLDERQPATTFYTSGTTGLPKGVQYSHRQVVLHTLGLLASFGTVPSQGRFAANDVYMPITPLFHAHAWGFPFAATMLGTKQVYPGRYDPVVLLRLIKEEKVSFAHCVATLLQMLLDHPDSARVDFNGFKMLIGGGALPQGLARRAMERGIDVFTGYGMSETGPVQTINHLSEAELALPLDEQLELRTRAGRPILLCDVQTVRPDMSSCDDGEAGEIVFRSPWLTGGYRADEQGSAALWEGGWLHSGDIGVMDGGGVIRITDRTKDVIKTGGEWVSSLLLESLISQVSGVSETAVIGIPDERWGERPMALVKRCEGSCVDETAIKAHLVDHAGRGLIARYAVPDRILFVEVLERTSVGKLDKKLLRTKYS